MLSRNILRFLIALNEQIESIVNPNRAIHGDARWANYFERSLLFHSKNQGMTIGSRKLSHQDSAKNLILSAAPGLGKTTSFMFPILLKMEPCCSAIVLDIKGELYEGTSGYLQSKGFEVRSLNLTNLNASHYFNPFHRIRPGSSTDAYEMAKVLVDL